MLPKTARCGLGLLGQEGQRTGRALQLPFTSAPSFVSIQHTLQTNTKKSKYSVSSVKALSIFRVGCLSPVSLLVHPDSKQHILEFVLSILQEGHRKNHSAPLASHAPLSLGRI